MINNESVYEIAVRNGKVFIQTENGKIHMIKTEKVINHFVNRINENTLHKIIKKIIQESEENESLKQLYGEHECKTG